MQVDINKFYNVITEKLSNWVLDIVKMLPNLALAALIFTIGLFLSRGLKRLAKDLYPKYPGKSPSTTFSAHSYMSLVYALPYLPHSVS